MARPSPYKSEFVAQVKKLAAHGLTDIEIADVLGVSDRTLYRWKSECPELAKAMKLGKKGPDDRVADSLFQRAVGQVPSDRRFSLPPKRYFSRHHLPPDDESSRYMPLPSRRCWILSLGLALRIVTSVNVRGALSQE